MQAKKHSVPVVAEWFGWSQDVVRESFRHEPGVVHNISPATEDKRSRDVMMIRSL
jgi:hypothetical protein